MPTGVYDRTKSKPNSGIFQKGEHPSPETEIKKGQRLSPSTEFFVGQKFERHFYTNPDWIRKQSESHKGQHNSPETEIKRGQRLSPKTEFKELVPGGVSTKEMIIRSSYEYIQWRKAVYKRDDYTCQQCNQRGGRLEAHHLRQFATHTELRLDVNNGITLCKLCHRGGDAHASEEGNKVS